MVGNPVLMGAGPLPLAQPGADKVGDGGQRLEIELGQGGGLGAVAHQRHHLAILRKQQWPTDGTAMQLYLGEVLVLEAFDQQQIELSPVEASQ
ncbi:hypothetical protein D3C78_1515990 [compost metagenome]